MRNSRYKPSHPLLRKIVRHFAFQSFEGTGNTSQWTTLFPNCTTNLCITLDSELNTYGLGKMKDNISTSCIRPVTMSRCSRFQMIAIQLEPYGFHLLTGLPMKAYKNSFFQLDDFFNVAQLERLYQRLYCAQSHSISVKILETFILNNFKKKKVDERIVFATHQLQNNPDTQLDELASFVELGTRRLRDLFALHIGISPKHYSRLSRFKYAAEQVSRNKKSTLTEIALTTGYFDQAHFIKEFKEFGGLSPRQFSKLTEKNAEFYNFER